MLALRCWQLDGGCRTIVPVVDLGMPDRSRSSANSWSPSSKERDVRDRVIRFRSVHNDPSAFGVTGPAGKQSGNGPHRKRCPAASHRDLTPCMSAATYHLWLKPSGPTYDKLATTIQELAQELNAPVFEPHVTLLSLEGTQREHVRRTEELARQLKAFLVVLAELSYRDEYFQCLFLNVQRTAQVMNANVLARQVFRQTEKAYTPHLSLLYGLYPEVRKRAVIARLRSGVRTSFEASAIHLIQADSSDPKDWHEISIAPMRG